MNNWHCRGAWWLVVIWGGMVCDASPKVGSEDRRWRVCTWSLVPWRSGARITKWHRLAALDLDLGFDTVVHILHGYSARLALCAHANPGKAQE